jgi:hypothetical protein
MKVMKAARRRGTTAYLDEDEWPPRHVSPTPFISGPNPFLGALLSDWQAPIGDEIAAIDSQLDPDTRLLIWSTGSPALYGTSWRGRGCFTADLGAVSPRTWSLSLIGPHEALAALPQSNEIVGAVDWISRSLGMAERDVLSAAGIRERTFYSWKSKPATVPRRGSQADVWALVRSTSLIVDALAGHAPLWFRSDPSFHELFVEGQHAKLVGLALVAAAAEADVHVPSDLLDSLPESPRPNPEKLKEFRTTYPVRFTHDEDGNPIQRAPRLEAAFYNEEAEDDLVLTELDD